MSRNSLTPATKITDLEPPAAMVGREDMTMTTAREAVALRRRLNIAHASRDYHKKRTAALAAQVRELKDSHRIGFQEGSAVATLTAYLAIKDFGMDGMTWLSERLKAVGKNPPHSAEVDTLVTLSVIESMKKYNPRRAAEVEASFAEFLSGDSK